MIGGCHIGIANSGSPELWAQITCMSAEAQVQGEGRLCKWEPRNRLSQEEEKENSLPERRRAQRLPMKHPPYPQSCKCPKETGRHWSEIRRWTWKAAVPASLSLPAVAFFCSESLWEELRPLLQGLCSCRGGPSLSPSLQVLVPHLPLVFLALGVGDSCFCFSPLGSLSFFFGVF